MKEAHCICLSISCFLVATVAFPADDLAKADARRLNYEKDPHEFTNLANDPKHTDTVAELKLVLRRGTTGP